MRGLNSKQIVAMFMQKSERCLGDLKKTTSKWIKVTFSASLLASSRFMIENDEDVVILEKFVPRF